MARLDSPISSLETAWRLLIKDWEDTKALWNDPVSQRFETSYVTLFGNQSQTTLKEMYKLAQLIAEAQRRVR